LEVFDDVLHVNLPHPGSDPSIKAGAPGYVGTDHDHSLNPF